MAEVRIVVDADACPVTRDAVTCARRRDVPIVLVGDTGHNLERHVRAGDPREAREGFWVSVCQVPPGPDSADFAIVSMISDGDIVVTQDMGLASMALGRGCAAIDVRGRVFDERTIDALLLVRHATKAELRRKRKGRPEVARHDPFDEDDRRRFRDRLDELVTAAKGRKTDSDS